MSKRRANPGSAVTAPASQQAPASQPKKKKAKVGAVKSVTQESLLAEFKHELGGVYDTIFDPDQTSEEDRAEAYQSVLRQSEVMQEYSWAVATNKALKIIEHFAKGVGIVEMAAGRGHWAAMLKARGVDIVPVDKYTFCESDNYCKVFEGGPKVLSGIVEENEGKGVKVRGGGKGGGGGKVHGGGKGANGGGGGGGRMANSAATIEALGDFKKRNLLLVYPDGSDNVSTQCLEYFKGQYIIHVGELFMTGTKAGDDQSPWGKTTDSEGQVLLAEQFHCVLCVKNDCLPIYNDYVTVWKRSSFLKMDDDEDDFDAGSQDSPLSFRAVPADEALPDLTRAAPKYAHLLEERRS